LPPPNAGYDLHTYMIIYHKQFYCLVLLMILHVYKSLSNLFPE
jgi:hypothetical protein